MLPQQSVCAFVVFTDYSAYDGLLLHTVGRQNHKVDPSAVIKSWKSRDLIAHSRFEDTCRVIKITMF